MTTDTKAYQAAYRAANAEKAKAYAAAYYAANKEKFSGYSAKRYAEHTEAVKAKSAEYRVKNPGKTREAVSKWHAKNQEALRAISKKYRSTHREQKKVSTQKYAASNRHKLTAKENMRRAGKLRATPAWANKKAIEDFYFSAQMLGMHTGIFYHVDHIVPLKSKLVCGLHCESNLQILPGAENISKGNRRWPDMAGRGELS